MGASGAGKSTLLNALTFRNTKGLDVSGDRSLEVDGNGKIVTRENFASLSAYVQGNGNCGLDWVFPGFPIYDLNVPFAARFRLGNRKTGGISLDDRAGFRNFRKLQSKPTVDNLQQDDLFVGTLTVLEQLEFYAALKMDKVDQETKRHRIKEIMQELGLERCKNTRIGVPGRKKVSTWL